MLCTAVCKLTSIERFKRRRERQKKASVVRIQTYIQCRQNVPKISRSEMEVSEKQRSAELNHRHSLRSRRQDIYFQAPVAPATQAFIAKFIRLLRNRTPGALDQIQYQFEKCTFRLPQRSWHFFAALQSVHVLVKCRRWFKFSFLQFQTTIPPKQRKIKFNPRIKLIHNIYLCPSDLRRRKQHLDS